MQASAIESQPVIFDADKKQKFGVSDTGEFIDTVYREQESSKLFGKLIGRNYVQPNQKKVFTTADIVCEAYLFKKGSWMKNWKKRYFILRKDIRSLCYYASREDLTLLGSIPLDIETTLTNVKAEEADGFGHVISMQTEHDNGSSSITYIRFDSFEKMKAWMIDIKNEAHNMKPTDEDTSDWWYALFNDIEAVEPKSNAMRRDGLTAEAGSSKSPRPVSTKRPVSSPRTAASSGSSSAASSAASPASSASPPEDANAAAKLLDDSLSPGGKKSGKTTTFNLSEKQLKDASENSDDDSDKEEGGVGSQKSHGGSSGGQSSSALDDKALPGAGKNLADKAARRSGLSNLPPAFKKVKALKPEKPHGPPPFEQTSLDRFETPRGEIAGYQLSLRLCNVCGFQDRIFVVIFGSMSTGATAGDSQKLAGAAAAAAPGSAAAAVAAMPGGSKWTQISRTELCTVTDKPEYGENYVNDFKIHFSIIQDLIPESCKDIKIAVYRLENEMNPKEPAKATNLNMQLEIARTIISRKLFDFKSILKISMQVKIELPMDIAIPLFKESEVTLGVVKLSSHNLYQQRRQLSTAFKCSPYSEILYSFGTNSGQTLSMEQLYASRYGIAVAQSLLSLWHQERYDYMEETLQMLREEFAFSMKDQQTKISQTLGQGESMEDKVNILFEPFRQAIDAMDEIFTSSVDNAELVLTNCENACQGKELMNNVIAPAVGGGVLRRSTWKKITAWQYCTTNLNLHLLVNKQYTFNEVLSNTESDARNSLHYIPTITMGVPAAHELKFHEGGLRKIFNDISDTDMKLQWMQAFQAPTLEPLKILFITHPREAQLLFGSKFALATKEDLAAVLKRKYELTKRIDICGSQALGCAVTVVKTVIMLASQHSGVRYMDILARSLKIGFVVLFESMLSTQGDELGMIEDMDLAVLWLSLVTIRLVQYPSGKEGGAESSNSSGGAAGGGGLSKIFTVPEQPTHVGHGEGVTVRRDSTGRLIVDLTITNQEVAVVNEAMRSMQTFDQRPTHHLRRDVPYCFDSNPIIDYAKDEVQPQVYAVAELFGIVFTQGVNEMQTLCNLSASRDVTRQVEINYGSLSRFIEFYRNYRAALEYQLESKTPELLDVLNHNASTAQANMIKEAAFGGASTSRVSGAGALPTAVRARRKSLRSSVSNAFINNSSEGLNAAVESLKAKVLNFNDRMLDQVHEAIAASTTTPHEKHVDVLLKTSALCREIGGTVAILCKSGKDRTSMGVTLENTRGIVEDLGVLNGQEVCQTMRQQGVRRMNVYANTGQPMFAFNQIQRIALPSCYRPPPGSHAGNITS